MKVSSEEDLRKIYADSKTIAVIGASFDESKPGHVIPAYLQGQGYKVIPVNPKGGELFGEKVWTSLRDTEDVIDVVLVFRPSEEAGDAAREAAAVGASVVWLQPGIESDDAEAVAEETSMLFVSGRCMGVTHGELGLGPGPYA